MNCTCSADIERASYLLIGAVGVGCVCVCGGRGWGWGGVGSVTVGLCVDSEVESDDSCEKEVKVIIEAVK